MAWGLRRYQQVGHLHFITFSCYWREAKLASAHAKDLFEGALEKVRRQYGMLVFGYVVMPEHVHLLVSEPARGTLDTAIRCSKQSVARRLVKTGERFWQLRYYDFNVWSESKRIEKLRYMHRNPVKRGLVEKPEDWPWSSCNPNQRNPSAAWGPRVFVITSREKRVWWRSSRTGRGSDGSRWGLNLGARLGTSLDTTRV